VKPLIILDPGHGGSDPGALGGSLVEKVLTLGITARVRRWIGTLAEVTMTRTSDIDRSLSLRCRIEQQAVRYALGMEPGRKSAFVSIHINASTSPAARGQSVFHFHKSVAGKELSEKILAGLKVRVPEAPVYNAGVIADADFLGYPLAVLRGTKSPAALVEFCFISNEADRALLSDHDVLDRAARGIAEGALAFLG
jgi:N-acetylmuramoyl-L-alanine amidase